LENLVRIGQRLRLGRGLVAGDFSDLICDAPCTCSPTSSLPPPLGVELGRTGFQRDGVARALRILDDLGGVLVCDR
jgi:hypothetical protein